MEVIKYSNEMRDESRDKKLYNIERFAGLDRDGLRYGETERRVLMHEYPTGEKLYIQFPGKETVRSVNPRPWDFRPKLQLANGDWLKDLSFKDVWDDLYALKDTNVDMGYVAMIFFRIAYMLDSEHTTRVLDYEDVDNYDNVVATGKIELEWYDYNPSTALLEHLDIPAEVLRGCSLLPYLTYNDYLAQNEDCKYYYRSQYEKNENWNGLTGRRNTLLTHMSVIAFIEGYLRFTEITDMFQRGLGVAPLSPKLWESVTGGLVVK